MMNWQQPRQILILFTLTSVFFAVGRFSLDPNAGRQPVTSFTFPPEVPLSKWQLLESRPLASSLANQADTYEAVSSSRQYQYAQDRQQLKVEMSYVAGTLGDFQTYLKRYTPQWQSIQQNLRHQAGVGFYNLFVYQGRSHLVACINPRGGSTVTSSQFSANRYTYDLQPERLLPWFLGQESLLDRRCLWAHLSTSLQSKSVEKTYSVLEEAWQSWYHWWQPRFPQH